MTILRTLNLVFLASAFRRNNLVNITENREFVVNLTGIDMVDKVMPTAKASSALYPQIVPQLITLNLSG